MDGVHGRRRFNRFGYGPVWTEGGLREYLLRGGFFRCDDFHGDEEWSVFIASMNRVFPDRQIVEIDDKDDPIFHTIYDLDGRYQVPGWSPVSRGQTSEYGGTWRTHSCVNAT